MEPQGDEAAQPEGRQLWTLNVPSGLLGGASPLCGKGPGVPWTYLRGAAALQGGLPIEADLQEGGTKAPLVGCSA